MTKFEMIREGKLTLGTYLLFTTDYCYISDVQVGRFKSPTTIIDSISLNTDLFTEVDDILAFIKKHLMVEYIITGEAKRTERFDYPLEAIREVVINMIVHRDYRESSPSIIKIYDDKIEFYNPGNLYGGISIDDLLNGKFTSKSRNKLIAKAFKEIGLIERYGSGIMRIQKICKEYGIMAPLFEEESNGFKVVLYKQKVGENFTENFTEKLTENFTENNTRLNSIVKNNKITTAELAKILGVSRQTIATDINSLKGKGKIQRIGPAKGGYWHVL